MLSDKIKKEINLQVNREMQSSYIYLGMVSYFNEMGLSGFAQWMKAQTVEELGHADKMMNYLVDQQAAVELDKLDKVSCEYGSPLEAFEAALEHERKVTAWINGIMQMAVDESDFATQSFLKWFIDEQIEEEASVGEMVDKLKMVQGGNPQGLLFLDSQAGGRAVTMPTTEAD